MERLGADPMIPVLGESPDLEKVLGKLAGLMASLHHHREEWKEPGHGRPGQIRSLRS